MKLYISNRAERNLDRWPFLKSIVLSLVNTPIPRNSTHMGRYKGYPVFKIRKGDFRILYRLVEDEIRVFKIDKRGRVYKR